MNEGLLRHASHLRGLARELSAADRRAAEALGMARRQQSNVDDRADALEQQLGTAENALTDLGEQVRDLRGVVEGTMRRIDELGAALAVLRRVVPSAERHVSERDRHWRAQRERAAAWVRVAESELADAQHAERAAGDRLRAADQRIRSAEFDLRRCRSDPDRERCAGEEYELDDAQRERNRALGELEGAQQRVSVAAAQLEGARQRLVCCGEAISLVERAVGLMQEVRAQTSRAEAPWKQAEAHADIAEADAEIAGERLDAGLGELDGLRAARQKHSAAAAEARRAMQRADTAGLDARRAAHGGVRELHSAADRLRDLSRISLAP
jgi:chromosome segregation ATPase